MPDYTVAELDALAEGLEGYPASGNKAEKVAALEAAGLIETQHVYRLGLRVEYFDEGVEPTASFMVSEAGGPARAVELSGDEVFETSDRSTWLGLRDLPFLEDEGEVS